MQDDRLIASARAAWSAALGCHVDDGTDFFDTGGTSLAAMQIISSLEEATGTRVPLRGLFDHPRFGDFVIVLIELHRAPASDPARA